jgi:hypothetical protein
LIHPAAQLAPLIAAWRPFLDPLDLQRSWFWLILPLAFLVSMTYKAVRVETLRGYWRQVVIMTTQLIIAIIAMGAAAFVVVEYVLPIILPVN